MALKIKKTKTPPSPITNEEIHEELKKLHLSVQTLMAVVTKLHEEIKHIHGQESPKKRWFGLAGGKQSWWS